MQSQRHASVTPGLNNANMKLSLVTARSIADQVKRPGVLSDARLLVGNIPRRRQTQHCLTPANRKTDFGAEEISFDNDGLEPSSGLMRKGNLERNC
jgi:hypothetical protein